MLQQFPDGFLWGVAQLGLFSVDRTTYQRTAKPSAAVYAALVKEQRRG